MEKRIKFVGDTSRIGMIHDVLKAIMEVKIDVLAVEFSHFIYLKLRWNDTLDWPGFCDYIKAQVPEIRDVLEVDWMEYEKREKELETLINNVDEAIITTNDEGFITFCNERAERIFFDENHKKMLGNHINKYIPHTQLDINSFKGEQRNIELVFKQNNKKEMALLDVLPMKNDMGKSTGCMIIVKDMKKVRKLLHSLSGPRMNTFEDIIGSSRSIKNAISMAHQAASSNSNIMLLGESGTGKELFARAIHQSSRRNEGPFITANCAAIPDTLLESEFFGYDRGAFTGADSSGKQGLFELSTEGTLFLDEIGDMTIHLQAKILRAIQERKIRRVGGLSEIDINTRIITATNKNLEEMVKLGTFRNDLYFRLNVIPIYVPPLRQRKEDIPLLTQFFLSNIAREAEKPGIQMSAAALEKLESYDWPGNIRELRNVIERAVYLATDPIEPRHLMLETQSYSEELPESWGIELTADKADDLPVQLSERVAEMERYYLKKALETQKSSRVIAKLLGISHTSVAQKIKKYHLGEDTEGQV